MASIVFVSAIAGVPRAVPGLFLQTQLVAEALVEVELAGSHASYFVFRLDQVAI